MEPVSASGSKELFQVRRLSTDKHLTLKTKEAIKLLGLSCRVCHSKGWRRCTFLFLPDFVAKSQNPCVYDPHFKEFIIPSLADFVDGDRDTMLLYPTKTIKRYLSRMEQFKLECSSLFISMTKGKKQISLNTILFWIRSVVS